MTEQHMITKEQFDSLFSDEITKKAYDKIIAQIDQRFQEICSKFVTLKKGNYSWYSYGNLDYDSEEDNGYFDPEEYKEEIAIGGEYIELPAGYDDRFPTRWLWEENWQEEMLKVSQDYENELELEKQKAKKIKEEKKKKLDALKASIKSKLTPAEFKIISFK